MLIIGLLIGIVFGFVIGVRTSKKVKDEEFDDLFWKIYKKYGITKEDLGFFM